MSRLILVVAVLVASGCSARARLVKAAVEGDVPATLITSVRVFDGRGDALSEPLDVLLRDGKVEALGPPGSLSAPQGIERVDGAGRTLLPGLIDCHVHLGSGGPYWESALPDEGDAAAAFLYAGVTTLLSAGHEVDTAALVDDIRNGREAGPRIFRASRIVTAEDGHPVPLYSSVVPWGLRGFFFSRALRQVTTPEEARAAVREELAGAGADFVKVVYDDIPNGTPHLTKEALAAIVDEARKLGTRTVVHVGSAQDAVEAAEAGAAMLMHTPWDDQLTDEQARRIAATGVRVVTTRRIFGGMLASLQDPLPFTPLERAVMLPGHFEAFGERPSPLKVPGFPDDYVPSMSIWDRNLGENLLKLRAAGVTLVAGTDTGLPAILPGAGLHEELRSLVALGIPAAEVLRMATSIPAQFLAERARYGVVEPGAVADLLLVDGDPLEDLAATQNIVAVWQAGRKVERRSLPALPVEAAVR